MKNRIRILAGILCLVLVLSSCGFIDQLNGMINKDDTSSDSSSGSSSNSSTSAQSSQDKVYYELSRLINSPTATSEIDNKTVSFVAYIATETFEETFTGEDKVYTYQLAYISRNTEPFYLDVTDVDAPEQGTYVTVTGTVTGSVYWVEDNQQEEILDFHAKTVEPFEVPEVEPDYENLLTLVDGTTKGSIEFLGAHRSKNSFNDLVVVYLEYTNNSESSITEMNYLSSLLKIIDVWYGDQYIKCSRTVFDPADLDSGSLDAYSMSAYTPSGKTQRYYITFEVPEGYEEEEIIYFDLFNDEYVMTNSIGITINETLEELYN